MDRRAAVGPAHRLGAVVRGIHDDRVVLEAELLELVQQLAQRELSCSTMPSGIDAESGFALWIPRLRWVQTCMRVAVPPDEERFVGLSGHGP